MNTLHLHTALPDTTKGAPDWLHLLPAGRFSGDDGRGPFEVSDADALIAHSMRGGKIPVDENHATEKAAEHGGSAPAQGWIIAMQARPDGIWGHVTWTKSGKALVSDQAYRGISPAFRAPSGRVTEIVHVSLTNRPNLTALTQLHTREQRMDLADLRRRLRLADTATQGDVEKALDRAGNALSLHTQAAELAGVGSDAGTEAIISGLRGKTTGVETHAQTQITRLEGEIKTLRESSAVAAAQARVDRAVAEGRMFTDEQRDLVLQMHSANPKGVDVIIGSLPLKPRALDMHTRRPAAATGEDAMLAHQAALWGQDPAELKKAMEGNV